MVIKSNGSRRTVSVLPLLGLIDHTLLKPEAIAAQIKVLCQEAMEYGFGAVCVLPTWVPKAVELLKDSRVKTCTVVGFPLGGNTTRVKVIEATQAIEQGAQEIDVVINLGALKDGEDDLVREELQQVVEAAGRSGPSVLRGLARPKVIVKVILETSLLNKEEKIRACLLAQAAGADFVKTSTGFGPGGATVEDVRLMREAIGPTMGIKASGGIRDLEGAMALLAAGATRLGTSAGVALATEWEARKKLGEQCPSQ